MSVFEGKKVLVTGGMGFIGSNLTRRLVELGAEVQIIDNLCADGGANVYNVVDFVDKVMITIGNVRDKLGLKWCIVDQDYIFNLAGQTSHIDSMRYPFMDLNINTCAQLTLLELCRNYNPDVKIVYASTRQLYGVPLYLPVDERHPVRPVDVNGINKWAGEQYHILYNNVYGIKSSVLRLTNTYGKGMRIKDAKQMFLGIWIRSLLESKPFEVWGEETIRDLTYVDDAVDAFLVTAESTHSNGEIYNLGGTQVTLKTLAEMICEVNGKGTFLLKKFPEERKKIDIGNCYSAFNKIEHDLGWRPRISLYEGLGITLNYYREHREVYV